jgi:hypothetical protein
MAAPDCSCFTPIVDALKELTDVVASQDPDDYFDALIDAVRDIGSAGERGAGGSGGGGSASQSLAGFGRTLRDISSPLEKFAEQFVRFGRVMTSSFASIFTNVVDVFRSLPGTFVTLVPGLRSLLESIQPIFAGIGARIAAGAASIGTALAGLIPPGLQRAVVAFGGYLRDVAGAIGNTLGAGGAALGAIGGAAAGILGVAVQLGQAVASLVGMASPATVQLFTNALEDMQAVIGAALVPVLDAITPIIRLAADTLITFVGSIGNSIGQMISAFMPVLKELFDFFGREGQVIAQVVAALTPVVNGIAKAFLEVWHAIQPVYELLLDIIGNTLIGAAQLFSELVKAVVPIITWIANQVRQVLQEVSNFIRELFGIKALTKPGEGTKTNASLGAAVKSVTITSVEQNIQAAQKAAYTLGAAGTVEKKPDERTADATAGILSAMRSLWEWLRDLPERMWRAIKQGFDGVVGAITGKGTPEGTPGERGGGLLHHLTFGLYGEERHQTVGVSVSPPRPSPPAEPAPPVPPVPRPVAHGWSDDRFIGGTSTRPRGDAMGTV